MVKKILKIFFIQFFILISLVLTNCAGFAQSVDFKEMKDYYNVTFYSGTLFRAMLQQKVSSEFNNVGDKVELINPTNVYLGEYVCIPENSKFTGKIVKVEKPKVGSNGSFQVIFDTLILPDGQNITIMASIWTKKGDGVMGGEMTPRTVYRPTVYNVDGLGSYIHKLPSGPRALGKNTELLPGSEVLIVLDQKMSFNILKE